MYGFRLYRLTRYSNFSDGSIVTPAKYASGELTQEELDDLEAENAEVTKLHRIDR
jgi:hypothetical protein